MQIARVSVKLKDCLKNILTGRFWIASIVVQRCFKRFIGNWNEMILLVWKSMPLTKFVISKFFSVKFYKDAKFSRNALNRKQSNGSVQRTNRPISITEPTSVFTRRSRITPSRVENYQINGHKKTAPPSPMTTTDFFSHLDPTPEREKEREDESGTT